MITKLTLYQFLNLFIMGNIELILNDDEVKILAFGTRQLLLDESLSQYHNFKVGLINPTDDYIRVYISKEL
jgi:hypothetical protein